MPLALTAPPSSPTLRHRWQSAVSLLATATACEHGSEDSGNCVYYDVDSHFVYVGRDAFVYGAKLWRATTSDDPELFDRLQPDAE